eukprot:COSAG01_NODE_5491_length_4227_cov_18.588178_4_plen_448_part_00
MPMMPACHWQCHARPKIQDGCGKTQAHSRRTASQPPRRPLSGRMYRTGEEAYSSRRPLWEQRQEHERRQEAQRPRSGEGHTCPLVEVPELDRYMFDLRGYFIIRGAVSAAELAALNEQVDANDPRPGQSLGLTSSEARAMMQRPHHAELKDMQQGFGDGIPALGTHKCFDRLIDHPSWISHIRDFVAGDDTRMTGGGGVTCRWPGQASGIHGSIIGAQNPTFSWVPAEEGATAGSGGGRGGGGAGRPSAGVSGAEPGVMRGGRFYCQTVSVLLALNDCPVGGGGTTVVPGSHKSNLRHPFQDPEAGHPQLLWRSEEPFARRHGTKVKEGGYMDGVPCAVELTMQAGDALLLVESCLHGSSVRTLPGCRRTVLLRYGPRDKGGWRAPDHIFERLSPQARSLIHHEPAQLPTEGELELDESGQVRLDHHGAPVRRRRAHRQTRGAAAKL